MNALDWRALMTDAPKLVHDEGGLVLVQLGERSVVFGAEADTHFFYEAYTALPALAAEVASLRARIDGDELSRALTQNERLVKENEALKRERADMQSRLVAESERATAAARRARVLASAILRKTEAP